MRKRKRQAMPEHFRSMIEQSDGCWLWSGSKDRDGYGTYHVSRVTQKAHRVSWELSFGAVPDGLCVLHKCDNPCCVRPDHLFLGTQADNVKDMNQKGRSSGNVQIPDEIVRQIKAMRASTGATFAKIGATFGISGSQACRICGGLSRKRRTA
jgi:hypothetical protein